MLGFDRVLQGAALEIDLDHVTARRLHGLLNRQRNFSRLTSAEANPSIAIADDGQCGETKNSPALYGFSHPVHLNQFFHQTFVGVDVPRVISSHSSTLEFQATGTGRIGKRLDPTMIFEPAAIKRHLGNASLLATLRE